MEPLPRFVPLDRTVAFSDAVFAVVITILVLGIEVPSEGVLSGAALALEREKLGHQLLVYIVSFWMIAMYWSYHSMFFGGLQRMDRRLAVLNLLFLLPVTLVPFVTQLMGAKRGDWRVVLVFGLTNLFMVIVLERMWKQVAAQPEIHKGPQTAMLAERLRRGARVFGLVMVLGVLLSSVHVKTGILLFLFMPIFYFYNYIKDPLRSYPDSPTATDSD